MGKFQDIGLIRSSIFVLIAVLMNSCGGGGGSSPAPPLAISPTSPVGGIWEGTFSSNVITFDAQIIGLASEDQEVRFISNDGVQTFGPVSVSGSNVSGNLTSIAPSGYSFVDGSQIGVITINGTIAEKQSLFGEYSGTGDQGTLSLQYNSLYDRDSSLSLLEGTWNMDYLDSQYIDLTLNVQSDGTFTGNDISGTTYEGNITIINPEYNCYRVIVTVTDVSNNGYVYSGLLALGDHYGTNNLLYFGVDYNNTKSIAGTFTKGFPVKVSGNQNFGGLRSFNAFAWSPDGSRIAYVAAQDSNSEELYSSTADGVANNVKLSGGGTVDSFLWSPDLTATNLVAYPRCEFLEPQT